MATRNFRGEAAALTCPPQADPHPFVNGDETRGNSIVAPSRAYSRSQPAVCQTLSIVPSLAHSVPIVAADGFADDVVGGATCCV